MRLAKAIQPDIRDVETELAGVFPFISRPRKKKHLVVFMKMES